MALAGGALATYMNGQGLDLLRLEPQMIVGLVIGSIFGIIFLKGIPVGPLMAAGITAIFVKLSELFFRYVTLYYDKKRPPSWRPFSVFIIIYARDR